MIYVGSIYTIKDQNEITIACDFTHGDYRDTLWFKTDLENENKLSLNNCDSFFVILVLYALVNKTDITFKEPISQRLFMGFEDYILPTLLYTNKKFIPIKISHNGLSKELYSEANSIGTAMSLGVDSFFTVSDKLNSKDKIDVLTLFNAGAFGEKGGTGARKLFHEMIKEVEKVAADLNLPLITVDSNLSELLDFKFIYSHTFRNLACVLLFQNIFKSYYYSAAYHLKDLKITNQSTAGSFDLVYTAGLSSNNLIFKSSGLFHNRLEKTKVIALNEKTFSHLNVCLITTDNKNISEERINCSKCKKCVRTMVTLDLLGKINSYRDVFDVEYYQQKRANHFGDIMYMNYHMKDLYAKEIMEYMQLKGYKKPSLSYYYLIRRACIAIIRKIKR